MRELKTCVVLNGKVINIGPWDDMDGNNPLPEGATIEEREFEYSDEYGWREIGVSKPPTTEERIQALEMAMLEMVLGGVGNGTVSGDPNPTGTDND